MLRDLVTVFVSKKILKYFVVRNDRDVAGNAGMFCFRI